MSIFADLAPLAAWTKERFAPRRWLLAAAFIVTASRAAPSRGPDRSLLGNGFAASLLWSGGTAFMLLFAFRLWDDLADLPHDRQAHPERVLARAAAGAPFRVLLVAVHLVNVALLAAVSGVRAAGYVTLVAAHAIYYAVRGGAGVAASHATLTKYAAFVVLVAPAGAALDARAALAAALVYFCFAVHELDHDPRLRGAAATRAFVGDALAVVGAAGAMMVGLPTPAGIVSQGALVLLTALWLALRTVRFRSGDPRARSLATYGVFFAGFLNTLNFALRS